MASTAVTPPYFFVNCTSSSAAVVVIRTIPHCLAQDPGDVGAGNAIWNRMQQMCQKLRQMRQKVGNRECS
jgi:hypothetical protein